MRKFQFSTLIAALLVSGSMWAVTRTANDLASLKDAIAAAETGDVIQLTGSIDGATTSATGALVPIEKEGVSFTLDLNGNHITGGYSGASAGTLLITAGDVTIKDSGTGGYLGTAGTSKYVVNIQSGAKVTLNSGIIYGGATFLVNNKGEFTMNDGSIIAQGSEYSCYAAYNAGVANFYDGCVKATSSYNGGTVYAINANVSSRTSIFGGKFGSFGSKATKDINNASFVGGGKFVHSVDYSDGYVVNTISEAKDDVTYTKEVVPASPTTMVAEVGLTQYFSLAKAFLDAPDNSTIRLINSRTISSLGIKSPKGKTLTLDLNNQSITAANCTPATSEDVGRITVLGNLTIKDASLEQGGVINIISTSATTTTYGITVPAGGSFTLESGTISGETTTKTLYCTYIKGDAEIKGGTVKGQSTTGGVSVLHKYGGTLTITGGNVHIKANDAASPYTYSLTSGTDVQISGGVFTREGASSVDNNNILYPSTVVTGGQFNFDPSAFVPVGDKMVSSGGTEKVTPFTTEQTLAYSIVTNPSPTNVIKNVTSGQEYASPLEAVSEANEGEELQLLNDVNLKDIRLVLTKGMTLDLNGHTMQGTSSSRATLSIQGGTDENPIIITSKAATKGKIIGGRNAISLDMAFSNVVLRDIEVESSTEHCINATVSDCKILAERVKSTLENFENKAIIYACMARTSVIANDCYFVLSGSTSANMPNVYPFYFNATSSLTINGGHYEVTAGSSACIIHGGTGTPVVTINDGDFSVSATNPNKVSLFYNGKTNNANQNMSIKGGYFTEKADPQYWLGGNYSRVTSDRQGFAYKVVEQNAATDAAANIYGSVKEAISAVAANPSLNPISLLRDVTVSSSLELPAGVTFAETSYTLTLSGRPALILQSGAVIPACLGTPLQASSLIGGKTYYYSNISDAFYDNSAIKLEDDIIFSGVLTLSGGTKTLDLNGHSLTGNRDYSLINLFFTKGATVLNLINTASQEGILENESAAEDSHVVDLDKTGMRYPGSYAKVVVGENVKLIGNSGVYLWRDSTFLEVYGSIESSDFAIAGNGSEDHWGTNIHIYEGASLTSTGAPAIYHPQYGELIIDGGTISGYQSAVEVRSGDVVINGGTFNASATSINCQPNESGTTTIGAAIAVAQHVTKNPINVTINGGTFEAPMALIQVNPQNNTPADYQKMVVNVTGGYFWSTNTSAGTLFEAEENYGTVTYDATSMLISANKRILLSGGYYNLDPSYFVLNGYMSVLLEDIVSPSQQDIDAMNAGYKYKVGLVGEGDADESVNNGDWSEDAASVWESGEEPLNSTPVTIDGQAIVVTTPAEAYSVELGTASATKLTVKDGGILVIGTGGVSGATADNLIVEAGGVLAIAPNQNETKPVGTVKYVAKYAGCKEGITTPAGVNDVYWEQFAIPTDGTPTSFTWDEAITGTRFNSWGITTGWSKIEKSSVNTPYTGYFITNTTPYSADLKSNEYVFSGRMVGNEVKIMKFVREGFTFFGNSYTAPINIPNLLQALNVDKVQATIYIYRPLQGSYYTINMVTAGKGGRPLEIEPLQAFFVYAEDKANVNATYKNIVWNALMDKMSAPAAPARRNTLDDAFSAMATLSITSANGLSDELVVVEGSDLTPEFDQNYDAKKLMNTSLNIFVPGTMDLAIDATNDLDGTPITITTGNDIQYTISFSELAGNMALFDAMTNKEIHMTEGGSYTFVADANSQVANRFSIRKITNVTTDIEEVKVDAAKQGIYTVTGMYVGKVADWSKLPQGAYIINGQKVIK